MDDQALLQEAVLVIEKLKVLNEDLRKEASEALKESRKLSAGLMALRSELVESERMQRELVEALRISEASWRSYREEAETRIRSGKISCLFIGIGLGIIMRLVAGMIKEF